MAISCCTVYDSSSYDTMCLLTLTPASGHSVTVNLFGAITFDIYDQTGAIAGYCIKGLNSSVKVSSASPLTKATVDGHILTCHGG